MTIRTGAEYLAGLRDGREVWLAGRRVDDVLAEPVLAAAAHTVARLYDQHHDPLLREVLTYQDGAERHPCRWPHRATPATCGGAEPRSGPPPRPPSGCSAARPTS